MRGRKPTPEKTPRLVADLGRLKKPAGLSKIAGREWDRLVPDLIESAVVCKLDLRLLVMYCRLFELWSTAMDALTTEGITFKTDAGMVKRHPAVAIASDTGKQINAILQQLGLSPLARLRVASETGTAWTEEEERAAEIIGL